MHILIIDDEKSIRQLICKMISLDNYNVYEAANGKEGLDIIKSGQSIDLVITDLIMPEKDGLEIIQELKREYPNIKILAMSGGGKIDANNYLTIAKSMGADLTLNKPFVKQELLDAINKLVPIKK